MTDYIERFADAELSSMLRRSGAVCIEGPKWCGKTWTARHAAGSEILVGDPAGNFRNRHMVNMSLDYALTGAPPRLIDEWQEIPELWDAVRFAVDSDGQKGKYILTGSATPKTKGVLHSGAGRIARLRMDTMSSYEIGRSSGTVKLTALFDGQKFAVDTAKVCLEQLAEYAAIGGWPGSIGMSALDAAGLATDYLHAVIEDDIDRLDGVRRNPKKMWALIRSLGRNESTLTSNQKLSRDITELSESSLDKSTVAEYLNILDRMFLLDNQPSFYPALRSSRRALKAEKRHFVDPSLAVAAIAASPQSLCNDLQTFGLIFEALCEHDLKIYARADGGNLYHFRDDRNNEIDAIVELADGRFGTFEIKLGAKQIDTAAAHLLKMRDIFEREAVAPTFMCVICGVYDAAYLRPDGVYVVPIMALRE